MAEETPEEALSPKAYEERLARLKEIVSTLEDPEEFSFARSMELFREGAAIVHACDAFLQKTELEVRQMVENP